MIIGLYSPVPRSGKTTFAWALSDAYESPDNENVSYIVGFADIMRDLIVKVSGPFLAGGETEAWEWLDDDRKDTGVIPELGVTHRHMLQTIGTEWGRSLIHPDIWVKVLDKRIEDIYYFTKSWPLIVIDDVRFKNEFDFIKENGGAMVKIVRPFAPGENEHVSHGLLDNQEFDYTVENTTLVKLKEDARIILSIESNV